ncbi:MAG: endo-1,4-beta-xylanase [Opitutales bacterium]
MRLPTLLPLLFSFFAVGLNGQTAVPSGGTELISPGAVQSADHWSGQNGAASTVTNITVTDGPGFTEAVEIDITTPGAENWNGQLQMNVNEAVQEDDVALLVFYMRTTAIANEEGTGSVLALVEDTGPSYAKSAEVTASAGAAWSEFLIPFQFLADYPSSTTNVQVKFGLGAGIPRTVQIGGVRLINYGNTRTLDELPETALTYVGREQDAAWRNDAAARIEAHRKADFALTFRHADGTPASGAAADFELADHAFEFGTAIDIDTLFLQDADGENYRSNLLRLFNAAGTENDLKWQPLAGDWGPGWTNQEIIEDGHEWLRLRGFELRGHVLVWPGDGNLPELLYTDGSAKTTFRSDALELVIDHIDEIVPRYSPWLSEWDVLNEPFTNDDLMEEFGRDIMADWFIAARANDPDAGLYLNDFGILSGGGQNLAKIQATIDTIKEIQADGGPITGMGFQGHFDESSLTSIYRVYEVLEEFATEFPGLDFRITEYDVTTDDQQLQADYLKDFYTIAFSHPQVVGIQMWGFWDGRHWRDNAALFELDWTPRAQLAAYEDLLAQWDSTFELTTNDAGTVTGRGFKGTYTGTVQAGDTTWELTFPVDDAFSSLGLTLPAAAGLTEARALPAPGPNALAIAFPSTDGVAYTIEVSEDGQTWRATSLPVVGSGHPQIVVVEVPSATTLWRVRTDTSS